MKEAYNFFKKLYPKAIYLKIRRENQFVLVTNPEGEFFVLNEVMGEIFLLSNGRQQVNNIVDQLYQTYDISKEKLIKDIVLALRDLQWHNLIKLYEKEVK